MNTIDFSTKSIIFEKNNITTKNYWTVAMDIGYSAVKGVSKDSVYSFPSIAIKSKGAAILGDPEDTDIQYKDENGVVWDVGSLALQSVSQNDTTYSEEVMYSRNRYTSDMFLVIARVGLALGMIANSYGNPNGKQLILQTGLPPAFAKEDAPLLRNVLAGNHKFSIKVGKKNWKLFDFTLLPQNIFIISQPMGSLFAATYHEDCSQVDNFKDYYMNETIIFDGGFGTLDTFALKNRRVEKAQTFDNLGMKAVLHNVSDEIYDKYSVSVSVQALQNALRRGFITKFDPINMTNKRIDFSDILLEQNKKVCMQAISELRTVYNNLIDCKYLIVTGGTGAAWFDIIKDYFKGMETLNVIKANVNTDLPPIFSNALGYYLFRASKVNGSR